MSCDVERSRSMKISLRAKAVVGIICMSLIISATAIALSYRTYANTMDEHYQKMCLDLAESAIAMLDSEKMKHYAETMEKDEYYDEQRSRIVAMSFCEPRS